MGGKFSFFFISSLPSFSAKADIYRHVCAGHVSLRSQRPACQMELFLIWDGWQERLDNTESEREREGGGGGGEERESRKKISAGTAKNTVRLAGAT